MMQIAKILFVMWLLSASWLKVISKEGCHKKILAVGFEIVTLVIFKIAAM
jgi:uncharacterized membrane protein